MKEVLYAVWITDHGYYAKSQPNYPWSFTHDIKKANLYKSKDGAMDRLMGMHGSFQQGKGEIRAVEVKTMFKLTGEIVKPNSAENLNLPKLEVLRERLRYAKKFKDTESVSFIEQQIVELIDG